MATFKEKIDEFRKEYKDDQMTLEVLASIESLQNNKLIRLTETNEITSLASESLVLGVTSPKGVLAVYKFLLNNNLL